MFNNRTIKKVSASIRHYALMLGFVPAMLFATSCSTGKEIPQKLPPELPEEARLIGFGLTEDAQWPDSRAEIIDLSNIGDLGIYGYLTKFERWDWLSKNQAGAVDPDHFLNTKLWNDPLTQWTYSPAKYWPLTKQHKLSFFAYSPYVGEDEIESSPLVPYPFAEGDKGVPVVAYTVPADIDNQIDLLHGSRIDMTNQDGIVDFAMDHALTRLTFSAAFQSQEEAEKNISVRITRIAISGVYREGILDLYSGKWTMTGEADPRMGYIVDGDRLNAAEITAVTDDPDPDNRSQDILPAGSGLMLLPQELPNAILSFTLTMVRNKTSGPGTETIVTPLSFPLRETATKEWVAGKSLDYHLLIKGEFISVHTSIKTWPSAQAGTGKVEL